MSEISAGDWQQFLQEFPNAHLLQTPAWAELKSTFGWHPDWIITRQDHFDIGAQILFRRFLPGISMAYIAKGPVYDQQHQTYPPNWKIFWQQVDRRCRKAGAAFLKVEPDLWVKSETLTQKGLHPTCEVPPSNSSFHPDAKLPPAGFKDSSHSIQPPRTLVLDLAGDESQILARMKQKTRYNIKLAQKHGVAMRKSSDIHSFYQLMAMTGSRDGFHFHSLEYYRKAYELFHPRQECELFIAEYDNVLLAAVMVFAVGQRAWYFYGASSNENRELMATYMVQWQAIQWAKARGCLEYDLWGVPDMDRSVLEAKFTEIHHGLWGVYRFKRGFGGDLRRSAGPWDRIYSPVIYALYRWRTQKRIEGLAVT